RQAEAKAALEAKLHALLKGEFRPRDNKERLGLAEVCQAKKLHHAAARLWADAFAADAKLADDLEAGHRYNAACYAALAAAGEGEAAARLGGKDGREWRRQALTWLRADRAARRRQLKSWWPGEAAQARQALTHWQQDSDLAGLRDQAALARLPAEERAACQDLWADLAALLPELKREPGKEAREQPTQPKVEGKGDEEAAKLNRATEYRQAGKRDLALPLLVEVWEGRKARLGPDHPDTLNSMNQLGVVYWRVGQLGKSVPLFEELVKLRAKKLG